MSIATYIKDDLAAQLKSGRDVPVQLTLDSLAGHYHVSLTPVRTAVAELIEEGLLERGKNHRLGMSRMGVCWDLPSAHGEQGRIYGEKNSKG